MTTTRPDESTMELLETQRVEFLDIIRDAGFSVSEFDIDAGAKDRASSIRYRAGGDFYFTIMSDPAAGGQYAIDLSPGHERSHQRVSAAVRARLGHQVHKSIQTVGVINFFDKWLVAIKTQLAARERGGAGVNAPGWVHEASPPDLSQMRRDAQALQQRISTIESRVAVLWQSGEPLNQAVRDMFMEMGYPAAITHPGETFDLAVTLPDERRLLIEITGIEGALSKAKGGKIAQIIDTAHRHAGDGDRIVVLVNAYRNTAPDQRPSDIVTADALRIVTALEANVLSTSTLYGMWQQWRIDPPAASARIEALHAQSGGLFV